METERHKLYIENRQLRIERIADERSKREIFQAEQLAKLDEGSKPAFLRRIAEGNAAWEARNAVAMQEYDKRYAAARADLNLPLEERIANLEVRNALRESAMKVQTDARLGPEMAARNANIEEARKSRPTVKQVLEARFGADVFSPREASSRNPDAGQPNPYLQGRSLSFEAAKSMTKSLADASSATNSSELKSTRSRSLK